MASAKKVQVVTLSEGAESQKLLAGQPQTCGMRSGRVYLKPAQSCGRHSTKDREELLIFLSGRGVALIGRASQPYEIGQGTVCYIPPHTIHDIKNTGSAPLIYIYCVAPAGTKPEKST